VAAFTGRAVGDLDLRDGQVVALNLGLGAEPVATFERAVHLAEKAHGAVGAIGGFDPPKVGNRFRRQSVGPSPAYSFTAQVAEVEVDADTGTVRIVDLWVAHDCGRALNPTIVEGQVEGCVAMGVGEALFEAQSYRAGVHTGPSLLSYKTPGVHDTPPIHVTLVESMDAVGPFGAKECGEGPQLGTVPAIANAIRHATGLELGAAPFTPEVVWRALRTAARNAEVAS
jgi:CO/xanthine dehydrogenase Mo-binding subunit